MKKESYIMSTRIEIGLSLEPKLIITLGAKRNRSQIEALIRCIEFTEGQSQLSREEQQELFPLLNDFELFLGIFK